MSKERSLFRKKRKFCSIYFLDGRSLSRYKKKDFVFSRCSNGTFPGHWYINLNEKSNSRKYSTMALAKSKTVCDEVNDLYLVTFTKIVK